MLVRAVFCGGNPADRRGEMAALTPDLSGFGCLTNRVEHLVPQAHSDDWPPGLSSDSKSTGHLSRGLPSASKCTLPLAAARP
jgi:hypothetical protein